MILCKAKPTATEMTLFVLVTLALLSLPARGHSAEPQPTFSAKGQVLSLAFAPQGKVIACQLDLRSLADGKVLGTGDPGKGFPRCTYVAFSPDGKRLASVHWDGGRGFGVRHALCLWDVTDENELRKSVTLFQAKNQPYGFKDSLDYLCFSPDGRMLATRMLGDRTVVWEIATGKERRRLDTNGLAVAFSPDNRYLITVTRTGQVQHWDLATGKCADTDDSDKRTDFLYVCNAVASADGKTLALSDHRSVVVKEARTGKTLGRFDNVGGWSLALSADGKTLAASGLGSILDVERPGVRLFDIATGKELGRYGEKKYWVHALAFSPDGKSLAMNVQDSRFESSVEVWDVSSLSSASKPKANDDPPSSLEAKVVSRKECYALALGGKTVEEFTKEFGINQKLPTPPEVDLHLTLRNTSNKTLTLDPDISLEFYLVGPGAVNHPELPYQTASSANGFGGDCEKPKKITLAPGATHAVPIKSLDQGHDAQSYWLLPGEYTLHLRFNVHVTPAPEGWDKWEDGTGHGRMRAAPIRLKVVAETK
jgi:WD40 repeat protein